MEGVPIVSCDNELYNYDKASTLEYKHAQYQISIFIIDDYILKQYTNL